ncbi:MAG: TSUP family transporter [Proteobacteria bacterium]|nr:TSUP family transporter [Pseudomonadota bacterium]
MASVLKKIGDNRDLTLEELKLLAPAVIKAARNVVSVTGKLKRAAKDLAALKAKKTPTAADKQKIATLPDQIRTAKAGLKRAKGALAKLDKPLVAGIIAANQRAAEKKLKPAEVASLAGLKKDLQTILALKAKAKIKFSFDEVNALVPKTPGQSRLAWAITVTEKYPALFGRKVVDKVVKGKVVYKKVREYPKGDKPGYLGLSGAPRVGLTWWSYLFGFLWAIWVGWIFSTVGAFGGIMAGVGHITIFGLGEYARSFTKGSPLNTTITDSIRTSNQWLVGLSALVSSFNYFRMGRLVLPLALCLAIGSVGGSFATPVLTAGQISLKDYIGIFGLCVFVIGFFLLYRTTPRGQRSKKEAKAAADAFQKAVRGKTDTGQQSEMGVKVLEGNLKGMIIAFLVVVVGAILGNVVPALKWVAMAIAAGGVILGIILTAAQPMRFTFYGVEFTFKPWIPIVGGIFIAALASFLGIGGGFLIVPFLTAIAGLPMFLVAGTSALTVLIGMVVSILTYMVAKGTPIAWAFIGAELVGIFVGSMIGPRTSKYIPAIWLLRLFVVLAFYVGVRYTLKGFVPLEVVPGFIKLIFVL